MAKKRLESVDHYNEQAVSCRKLAAATDLENERARYDKAAVSFERLADMALRVQQRRSSESDDPSAP